MHELQDEAIIQLVLQGNNNAYAVLVERYQHFVFTLAFKFLKTQEDAEEAAQDAFVKAYRSLDKYNSESKFSTWLYTIARNTCLSRLRVNKPDIKDEADITETVDSTNELLDNKSKKEVLNKAISLLSDEDAIVITLFYIQEQSIDEIVQITGQTKSNVKVRLYRARKRLKEILDKHFAKEMSGLR